MSLSTVGRTESVNQLVLTQCFILLSYSTQLNEKEEEKSIEELEERE